MTQQPDQDAFRTDFLRPEAANAPDSGIVEVFSYGRGKPGLIPLWVGEGDMPTPAFIHEAAQQSLVKGETFYTYQRGIPELRQAIADYMSGLYGQRFPSESFFVTTGGMLAVQIAVRLVAGAGDEVIVPTPAWPNFEGALGVSGARAVCCPMQFDAQGWTLDLAALAALVGPRTRAIVINSPGNPTGWTASRAELQHILALAREKNLWIIADEIYGRFVYEGTRAASFHDVKQPEDRILFIQSMSKNWAMTGWRVGWLQAPAHLGQIIENLVQYSVSGVPVFLQRAAVAALEGGDDLIRQQVENARAGRHIICEALAATGRVRIAPPAGAFYVFFAIEGLADSRRAALRMVDEANVGLAPGTAFGPGGEAFFRLCFGRKTSEVEEASRRLAQWIARI